MLVLILVSGSDVGIDRWLIFILILMLILMSMLMLTLMFVLIWVSSVGVDIENW